MPNAIATSARSLREFPRRVAVFLRPFLRGPRLGLEVRMWRSNPHGIVRGGWARRHPLGAGRSKKIVDLGAFYGESWRGAFVVEFAAKYSGFLIAGVFAICTGEQASRP